MLMDGGIFSPEFVSHVQERREIARRNARAMEIAEATALRRERLERIAERVKVERDRGSPRMSETERIIRRACRIASVRRMHLMADCRQRHLVHARWFAMYWIARRTPLSYPAIGRILGDRDHTTVMHGKDAYRALRAAHGRNLGPAR